MASSIKPSKTFFFFFFYLVVLALSLCMQAVNGDLTSFLSSLLSTKEEQEEGITCEHLPTSKCAFAVSSSGNRCILENKVFADEYDQDLYCRTSEIRTEKIKDYIETDKCINVCGVDRYMIGISTDSFFEPYFLEKLCSFQCYYDCSNIIELYFKLAAGEGLFLPSVCETTHANAFKFDPAVAAAPMGLSPM